MAGSDRLYELLPAIYRERDEELGGPLRALLHLVQEQADLVEADVRQLWDDFFVETAEPWVIPYLGDLVGTTPLFDASRVRQPDTARGLFGDLRGPSLLPPVALRNRADVAKTIYYRRRKGVLPMLEELARDVTGWAAHAVEFFELLGWTQCVRNHLRMHSPRTPDLRRLEPMDRLDGPFDEIAHTVDVAPIHQLDGWHNVKNIGFFLWRLRSHELENVPARQASPGTWSWHASPLNHPAPLFSRLRREGDEAGLATELHVPGPLRPLAFWEDLKRYAALALAERFGYSDVYGLFDELTDPVANPAKLQVDPRGSSLMVLRNGVAVPPEQVIAADLGTWVQPASQVVAVDVRRGRLAFGLAWPDPTTSVDVWFHHGFSADLGGGTYPRRAWQVSRPPNVIEVDQSGKTAGSVKTLDDALTLWQAGKPNTVIRILDSRTYHEDLEIDPAPGRWLVIEAADGVRPHLRLKTKPLTIKGLAGGSLTLSGLLVEGWIDVLKSLDRLRLLHTTLVPGRSLQEDGKPAGQAPSLVVREEDENGRKLSHKDLRVEIAFSITGPLHVPERAEGLWLLDSIVDGVGTVALTGPTGPSAPPTWMERVTILGPSYPKELPLASEVIFTGPVVAERLQEGCVRFSFVPAGSATPRRYRCQPDLEIARRTEEAGQDLTAAELQEVLTWLVPSFTDTRYGQPAYAQLHLACPEPIRTGAEDGSEMGVFCHLKQPQREANLRLRLEEYLPFGLEPGIIYVT
jgi:hypothetical protein